MINVSFNGTDMSGKSTLMKKVKKMLNQKSFKVGISPHLMKFTEMSLKERLDMYETWTPEDFTEQALGEVIRRSEYNNKNFSGYDFVLNDRGVLTQVGFCIGKYMTEYDLPLEVSFRIIDKRSRELPFERVSVTLDIPLEVALARAEGNEIWGEHYQRLIQDTREAIKYLGFQDYNTNIFNLSGIENLNKLRDSAIQEILDYKTEKDAKPK